MKLFGWFPAVNRIAQGISAAEDPLRSSGYTALRGGANDFHEIGGFEAGAANERAVDIRLAEEFGGVIAFDRSAVQDADRLSRVFAVKFGVRLPDRFNDGLVRLVPGRGEAGANRPLI